MAANAEEYIDPQLLSGQASFANQYGTSSGPTDEGDRGSEDEDDDEQEATVSRKRPGDVLREGDENGTPAVTKKSRKPRSEDAEIVEEDGNDGTEQDRRRREMNMRIDAAAKGQKKRPRKKADETDLDQMADDEVVRMRDAMQQAANDDHEANEKKKPATAKLRMLKEAVETLQKTGYQQAILDNNLLEAVRMWLEPLPDRSLPSLNIQKALFPLLDRMYIDSTSLKMSGLGKLVLFYTRCKRVDRSIARIADRLIESWSRPILKRSSSYRDRQQARKEYQADPARAIQRAAEKGSQSASQSSYRNARIPESVTGNAFKYAPITSVSDHPDEARSHSQKINKFKRSMQAARQR